MSTFEQIKKNRVVFLVTIFVILAVVLAIQTTRNRNLFTRASLTDPLRQLYQADDLVINLQPLRNEFTVLEKNQNISLYFEALNTGANIAVNKDTDFFPASLLKVPLIMAATKKIERGEWQWTTKLKLTEADKNKDFGTLWQQPSNTEFTIEELVKQTLIKSDNTAYFVLLNNLDPSELIKVQNHLGLTDFISADLEISAKKYAPILRSLFSATYLTVENSEKILAWMTQSHFNNYLAGAIPSGTKFSHKIGVEDEKRVYLDAGIVYVPNRPYIVIVMVKNYNANEADAIMHDISQRIYRYMVDYPKNI